MRIHCIGIGGIGVSALAQYYFSQRHEVSGSDLVASEITEFLKKRGVKVVIGNVAENINANIDLVVYSPAVPQDNPELQRAKTLNLKLYSYPEALGELTRKYTTIAVAGAHGKSTTTSMIGLVLEKAGLDPTVIVGTKLKEFGGSNFRGGKGQYLVIEACEYDDSFNNYSPKIIVVTNIDKEHLDYFKNMKNVIKAFSHFIAKLPRNGFLVFNKDDQFLVKIHKGKFSSKGYSQKQEEAKKLKSILQIPGDHNVSNAFAALATARILHIKDSTTFKTLAEYKGSWRRFEIIKTKPYVLISDYGHHPNEILATLKATREKYANKKIWCIFQPHQYQRTHYLFSDFVKVFRNVHIDNIIITDIYDVAGREEKKISAAVSSESLVKKINKKEVTYFSLSDAEKYVKKHIDSGDVLIIMGAGDIYKLVDVF